MEVRIVSASVGDVDNDQFLMSTIVDGETVIDAGSIGFVSPLTEQQRIRHVLLSHSHVDHIASLPIFLDNVFSEANVCPTVYGSEPVLATLQEDIFNGRLWPDLVELSTKEAPFLRMQSIQSGVALQVAGLRVTPIALSHVVPTLGFVIESRDASIAFVSDTAPTDEIWRVTNQVKRLRAVFVESSFPSRMQDLAETTMHLTPTLLKEELKKLEPRVRIIVVHIKPAYRAEIEQELSALNVPQLEIGTAGQTYHF